MNARNSNLPGPEDGADKAWWVAYRQRLEAIAAAAPDTPR